VFEQRSPAKPAEEAKEKAVQEAVDCIQARLAEVTIHEASPSRKKEEKIDELVEVVQQPDIAQRASPARTTGTESQNEEPAEQSPTGQSPLESVPKAQKRYETMVEVRISPKPMVPKPQEEQTENQCAGAKEGRTRRNKVTPRLSSSCVLDDKVNAYVRPILNEALSPVVAQSTQKFDSWAARAGNMLEVVKVAEGSYGEVYKLRLREEVCKKEMSKSKLARLKEYGDGVFKVVPLRAKSGPGSKKFTSIEELVSEVKMLKYLDPIPGFARFREIHVVQGRFPESFQKAWDYYKKTKDDCLNPNPASKRSYPDSQLWAIVEMDDAGCELEKFAWSSIFQIYDIFWGVAMALARAEEYALFEVMRFLSKC
jgi:serine/threonine-protein kinase haspin